MIDFDPGLHLHHGERLGGELELPGEREPAAWSAPRTWVAGEVLTASLLNTHLRDQLLYLGGTDRRTTSPPGAPLDGQLWHYVADATNGIEWLSAYNSGDAGLYKWHSLSGSSLSALVGSATTVGASAAYIDPGTVCTLTVPRAGNFLVDFGGVIVPSAGHIGHLSLKREAVATSDADTINTAGVAGGADYRRTVRITAAASGVYKLQGRDATAGPASIAVSDQVIRISPERIS